MEPVQPVQMNIYCTNTYRKDFRWLYFDSETRIQKKQQMKGQQSRIPVSVAYPTYQISNCEHWPRHDNIFHRRLCGRFIEIKSNFGRKKLHKTNNGSIFLRGSFSNRDNVRAPIQHRK